MQQHIVWQHSTLYSICSMPQYAIHLPNAKQCSISQHVALQHVLQLHLQQLCRQQCTLHQHARQHCVQLRYAPSVGPISSETKWPGLHRVRDASLYFFTKSANVFLTASAVVDHGNGNDAGTTASACSASAATASAA
jgi:hypothetical protein